MVNRLSRETSPYLRQHAHNPVDWYPWGEEAFERARKEDRPIFLSIGYSSCHWCHVMERESFENEEIARVLNERFVSIKVDREERPDVDDVYMTAVQLTSGRGGWPLSAFLTPDARPFFAGTYFPPEDRHGRAGFKTILLKLSETFRERRDDVEDSAERLAEALREQEAPPKRSADGPLDEGTLEALDASLARSFDAAHGGFGGAPKFPPHQALEWLLLRAGEGDEEAGRLARTTLDAMALGGVHDHLAGGFHRYSTDERWLVPHFEKMLYDNAQLLSAYARGAVVLESALHARAARGIAEYLLREMRGPEGGFFAATDADSEGEEGRFFVWSEAELREALGGGADADLFLKAYQVRRNGNYHDEATGRATGLNILHRVAEATEAEEARLQPLRQRLLERRAGRVPPALDDKRVAGWNALAVSGLARAGSLLGEPRYLAAARETAGFLLATMRDATGRLVRTWKDGEGKVLAFLEDEAYLANALLDLADSDPEGRERWIGEARRAVDVVRTRFRRPGEAGFTFSGEGHEALLMNGRDLFDKATPSGSGSAARALARLALATGDAGLAVEALAAVREVTGLMGRAAHGTESWYLALRDVLAFEARHGALDPEGPGSSGEPQALARRARDRERGPVGVALKAPASPVPPGGAFDVEVAVTIASGFHLPAEGGLAVEGWAGGDVPLVSRHTPAAEDVTLPDGSHEKGHAGGVECRLTFQPSREAARGERLVSVLVRVRACGAGSCLPDAVLSATVPVRIGAP